MTDKAIQPEDRDSPPLPRMLFHREQMRDRLRDLARSRLYVGACSWKFTGWCGMLYDEDRYLWRGRFSKARFERSCLSEYAETFPTVLVESFFYHFPTAEQIEELFTQAPESFLFSFKIPERVTLRRFPDHDRFGTQRAQRNPDFLRFGLLEVAFLRHLEPYRHRVGLLILEFSHFHPSDFRRGRDFVAALDRFLGELPDGWQFGVEIRNRNFLHPEYFEVLRRHGVAHVLNQWTLMPPVPEQMRLPGVPTADFGALLLLVSEGQSERWAQEHFQPFHLAQEVDTPAREGGAAFLSGHLDTPRPSFLYVHNCLEGNALHTLADLLTAPGGDGPDPAADPHQLPPA